MSAHVLFAADGLAGAVATGPANRAFVMPVPCQWLAGEVLIFPWPTHQAGASGAGLLVLDLDVWLVCHPAASTLPLRCASQNAAYAAANAFSADVEASRVVAEDAGGVREWCRWWSARRSDAVPLDDWAGR